LFVAIDTCQADIAISLHLFVGPLLFFSAIFLAVYAAVSRKNRRRCLQQLATLAIFLALLTASFFFNHAYPIGIRSAARWLIWSHDYKAEVLARPEPLKGELRHIEWDGGGMFAQDWSVFLVFDPTDSLAGPARRLQSGRLNGIPCGGEVGLVRRMDSQWYIVFFPFYADDSSWDRCS
jgi:hypothetical protein